MAHIKKLNEEIEPTVKSEIEKLKGIVSNLNVEDFEVVEVTASNIYFSLANKRYRWDISYRMPDVTKTGKLKFVSVPSYGSFESGDDEYKFYKSIGVVLTQTDVLAEIEKQFAVIGKLVLMEY